MIYTVFPVNDPTGLRLPQDFPTMEEAEAYAEEELGCEYVIESTNGECV